MCSNVLVSVIVSLTYYLIVLYYKCQRMSVPPIHNFRVKYRSGISKHWSFRKIRGGCDHRQRIQSIYSVVEIFMVCFWKCDHVHTWWNIPTDWDLRLGAFQHFTWLKYGWVCLTSTIDIWMPFFVKRKPKKYIPISLESTTFTPISNSL